MGGQNTSRASASLVLKLLVMTPKYISMALMMCLPLLMSAQQMTNFQKPFSRYSVKPDSCIRIEHTSGSLIFIEANAIITDNMVVDVLYREYLTPLDMIVHGISMNVNIGGKRLPLESTGMFEIYAVSGTDTLRFNPDKRMEVRLAGQKALPGVEGYKYDMENGDWDSYTSRIDNIGVQEDDELWGNSIVEDEVMVENFDEPFGVAYVEDAVREQAFQSMEIDDFGFYNYDRIIEGLEYVFMKPSFITANKKDIKSTIYVVYNDINSVFYFDYYTWVDSFFLVKGKDYKLFTIAENGQVFRLDSFPDLSLVKDTSMTFSLNLQKEIPTSRESLSTLTGIQ
jgi:hypothetical protein